MIRQILSGYLSVLRSILVFLALLAVCVGVGSCIVWPLWRLADSDPKLYSLIFACLASLALAWLVFSACRRAYKRNARAFFLSLAGIVILVAGLAGSVYLVLEWKRIPAGIVLLITLALYGVTVFGLVPQSRSSKK